MRPVHHLGSHAVLFALIAMWGVSYVAVKDALSWCAPTLLVAVRFWLGALTLAPLVLLRSTRRDLAVAARWGVVGGGFLTAGFVLQSLGMRETSASMGGFLAGLIPLLVALGGRVLLGARVGRLGAIGLTVGFAGMLCLVWPVHVEGVPRTDTVRGVLLQVASSTSFAGHVLLLSRVSRGLPTLPFCLWQLVCTALAASVLFACEGVAPRLPTAPGALGWLVFELVFLGVLATGVGIAVQARIQPGVPPMHVALLFALQPLFAALAGAFVRGEAMTELQLLGGATIVLGIVVTALDARPPAVAGPGRG